MTIRVLGVDPGSQITGFGVVDCVKGRHCYLTSGCIRIGKFEWPKRLQHIFEDLKEIILEYRPEVVALEKIFVHKNVSSALKLGHVRGVVMLVAALHELNVAEYTPRQVKKTVVGTGGAEKVQVQHMMQVLLKLNGLPQADAADALAVALCHIQTTGNILQGVRS